MTSTPSFIFSCSYLLVFPLLVGVLFQEVSWCSWLPPTLFYGRPPPGYECVSRAFLDSHSPWCLWSQFPHERRCGHSPVDAHHPWWVCTLPGHCAHSLVGACGLRPLRDEVWTLPSRCAHSPDWRVTGWRADSSCCCRGIPQSAPQGLCFFGKILLLNPAAPSLQGRACPLTQPTSPARPRTFRVRAPHSSTLKSPQLAPMVSVGLPLRPYSPPCDFKQPGLSQADQALFGRGGSC